MQRRIAIVTPLIFVTAISLFATPASAQDDELTDDDYSECAIAKLFMTMEIGTPEERGDAMWELAKRGPEVRKLLPRISETFASTAENDKVLGANAPSLHQRTGRLLGDIGIESLPVFKHQFTTGTKSVRPQILLQTRSLRSKARVFLPIYRESYKTVSEDHAADMLGAIAAIDPDGQTALPLLLHELQHNPHEHVRQIAAHWLSRETMHKPYHWDEESSAVKWVEGRPKLSNKVATALREALSDRSPAVRAAAIRSLATYPESKEQNVIAIMPLIDDFGHYPISYTGDAFGTSCVHEDVVDFMSRYPKVVYWQAIKSTINQDIEIKSVQLTWYAARCVTLRSAQQMPTGPLDISTAPAEIDELKDYWPLSPDADEWIYKIGPDVIPLLIDALNDPKRSPGHNARCMLALGRFGPEAEIAVFALFKKLNSKFPRIRITAIETLSKIGTQPGLVLPELKKRLNDPRPLVRAAALRAIASYANSPGATSKSEVSSYRSKAIEYIPDLEKAVWDEFLDVQYATIQSLASFGSEAKTSLPDLKAISRNTKSDLIKLTALDAIKAIETDPSKKD